MNNRNSSSPIICAIALSLVVQFPVSADLKPISQSDSISLEKAGPGTIPAESTISTQPVSSDTPSGPIVSAPAVTTTATALLPAHTSTYTVVKGDSLTRIAEKFNTTRKKLAALNSLTVNKVTPGQVILVPSYKKSKSAIAANTSEKPQRIYPKAQPVQGFDISASTLPPRPVPTQSGNTDLSAHATGKPAPVAKLVSPSELAADMARNAAPNVVSCPSHKSTGARSRAATPHGG